MLVDLSKPIRADDDRWAMVVLEGARQVRFPSVLSYTAMEFGDLWHVRVWLRVGDEFA